MPPRVGSALAALVVLATLAAAEHARAGEHVKDVPDVKVAPPAPPSLGPPRLPKRTQRVEYLLCSEKEAGCKAKACSAGYRPVMLDDAKPAKRYCALGEARLMELSPALRLAVLQLLGRRPKAPPPP